MNDSDERRSPNPGAAARPRQRDAASSRAAILTAAGSAFAELGYGRATIREIAQRAGVTHGLVMKHFSSKERLFIAAVPGARDIAEFQPTSPKDLPAQVARAYVERMDRANGNDAFIAVIRSAATDETAAAALHAEMRARSVASYRVILAGLPDLDDRVELLGAHLIGVTFARYVMRTGPLADMPAETLVMHLTRTLTTILFDGEDAPAGNGH